MKTSSRRFARMAYLRAVERIMDAVDEVMPYGVAWRPLPGERPAEFRRREKRIGQLERVWHDARELLDSLETLR